MEYWVLLRGGERDGEVKPWAERPDASLDWWFPRTGVGAKHLELRYRYTEEKVCLPDGRIAWVLTFDG
ncbi:hypothetical protein [Cellulomonas sp. Leaf334]|uniref:hypothetical protein n=1 Tax=Cellulomonas sp. Leaf334 TaxID=1736339 RepID=UPI0006FC6A88|nr:hypothetical protein [Cellulomonas sp. Leaf334]KQR07694.1 hypothetical protein ASF78_20685 [Cellulomonas sp. Leaf334]